MAVDIGLIFTALGVAKSVAEFVGILDSIESKVERLVHSELNAGLRMLEQGARATSEQVSLLREARGCFNKAASLETGYRKVVALLGLSLCHHALGDRTNHARALEEVLEINPVTTLNLAISVGIDAITDDGETLLPSVPSLLRHPVVKYGALMFSSDTRKEYYRNMVMSAMSRSNEAMAISLIQESVSKYSGKPIPWREALA